MNPKKYILIVLLSTLCSVVYSQSQTFGGTVILIFGDSSQVIVAADSRVILNDSIAYPNKECKIRVFGNNSIFVTTGVYYTAKGFDIFNIAKESFNPDSSFDYITRFFQMKCMSELHTLMTNLKNTDTIQFAHFLKNPPIGSAWIRWDGDLISVFWYSFQPIITAAGNIGTGDTGNLWRTKWHEIPFWLPLGIPGFNKLFMNKDTVQRFLQNYGYVDGMVRLVQQDIARYPKYVGEPVDVLSVNRTGIHWQKLKPECKECDICPTPQGRK